MAILECKGLCKSYGAEPALDRVDLSVEPGHIVGLLGPNGSGKSTLIKLANGLLTPDAGEILIDGMAPSKETKKIESHLLLQSAADELRAKEGKSVDAVFREVFRC